MLTSRPSLLSFFEQTHAVCIIARNNLICRHAPLQSLPSRPIHMRSLLLSHAPYMEPLNQPLNPNERAVLVLKQVRCLHLSAKASQAQQTTAPVAHRSPFFDTHSLVSELISAGIAAFEVFHPFRCIYVVLHLTHMFLCFFSLSHTLKNLANHDFEIAKHRSQLITHFLYYLKE